MHTPANLNNLKIQLKKAMSLIFLVIFKYKKKSGIFILEKKHAIPYIYLIPSFHLRLYKKSYSVFFFHCISFHSLIFQAILKLNEITMASKKGLSQKDNYMNIFLLFANKGVNKGVCNFSLKTFY